jgi:hypothetical protein
VLPATAPSLDGSPVDMMAITAAIVAVTFRLFRRQHQFGAIRTTAPELISDALNGAAVVPFILMICAVFSSGMLNMLVSSSKVTIGLGGVIGVIYSLAPFFREITGSVEP